MSAIHAITLPKWGLEMSEGTISAWHVAEGATVEKGADLVDIETDKIVNTLDIERSGTVRRILARAGDVLPVGALIAVLAPADVKDGDVDAFVAAYKPINASFEPGGDAATKAPSTAAASVTVAPEPVAPPPLPEPATKAAPAGAQARSGLSGEALKAANDKVHATPIARRIATQLGIDLSTVAGAGRNGRISREDVDKAAAALGLATSDGASAAPAISALSPEDLRSANLGVHASPIARKVANAHGIELGPVPATGARGRISLADVRKAAAEAGVSLPPLASRKPAKAVSAAMPPQERQSGPARQDGATAGEIVPFAGMRRSIAQAMQRAKQTVPHFYTTIDVEVDALVALRKSVNGRGDGKASLNDFILRAAGLALARHPDVNVHVFDEGIRSFDRADIAMAVAIDGGLITPVLRDVAGTSVTDIARASAVLAEKARTRALSADDLKGATFTVSNLGMFGVRQFDAIVTPPQAAILAVGGARREAHEKDGGIGFVSVLSLTLSADHRAVDGALAARFLATLRDLIQDPLSLMM